MTQEEEMQRAEHARQVMEDPLVQEAFSVIEKEILSQWEECPARDVEGRERLWQYYKIAKKFRGVFEGVMETGKIAKRQLEDTRPFMDRMLRRNG